MGVVYRAGDTKLDRPVALKFLPAHLLGDEDVRRRFEREAKSAAALSHSNVCVVHEIDEVDGKTFIAMELVEGQSLDKLVAKGPLKLDQALDIAQQVAKGLEAAHKRGIVHRDIKPENIMVGDDGHVTIMDFGLAQLTEASRLTRADETVGTVAYMSPEQTDGSGTDHRTDIWSLGVVIYEMITGQQPFKGDYDKAVMYSILNEEPEPVTAVRTGVPTELERVAAKCMAKAVNDRYGSAAEAERDLRILSEQPAGPSRAPAAEKTAGDRPALKRYVMALVAAALLGALATWALITSHAPGPLGVTRLHLNLPGLDPEPGLGRGFAISPDGSAIAYVANGMINLRELGSLEIKVVPGTEGGYTPFFSPDGEWLGFLTLTSVNKVSLRGGPPTTLAIVANPGRAFWGPNDTIIFDTRGPSGLMKVSAAGGETLETFTTPADGEIDHSNAEILPDGDTVTFGLLPVNRGWATAHMAAKSLSTGRQWLLISGQGGNGRYAPTGHLVHQSPGRGTLTATPFDAESATIVGQRVPVLEGLRSINLGNALTFSRSGTLAYLAARPGDEASKSLVWVDRNGREEPTGAEAVHFRAPRVSPDGERAAVISRRPQLGTDVLLYDLEGGVLERTLAQFEGNDNAPVWSADGSQVFYISDEGGGKLLAKSADASDYETLAESWIAPQTVSPDGSALLYVEINQERGRDIGVISLYGDRKPTLLLDSPALEDSPTISPDGRYLAYSSTESGRSEIYVSPFPNVADGRWTVSRDGGSFPAWARDGTEIYFLNGRRMMAARRFGESGEDWAEPVELFSGDYYWAGPFSRQYDVAADGRFLMIKNASGSRPEELTIVLNWFEELRRLAPPD